MNTTNIHSQDYSSSEESDGNQRNRNLCKIGKSEQKNKIVRNIFLNVSKGDGGAKGKGQVLIVDHSEESQKSSTNIRYGIEMANSNVGRIITPIRIVCKIDLSRLSRIPNERKNFIINNNNEKSVDAEEVNLRVREKKYI